MMKVLMVLSAISAVITLALVDSGRPLLAMAGVVVTLVFGAFESLLRINSKEPATIVNSVLSKEKKDEE